MNARSYLYEHLGGNLNVSTLTPLAICEIMERYNSHKTDEWISEKASFLKGMKERECKHEDKCEKRLTVYIKQIQRHWCPLCEQITEY